MATITVKIEGLKELDAALGQLTKATAKGVLRRVLQDAGEITAQAARGMAPIDEHHLYESIDVGTQLSDAQKSQHKEQGGKAFQEMFVGTNNPAGTQQEFGNSRHGAQPFMRPAWDSTKGPVLERISNNLWAEISKAAARASRRSMRFK
jgi:HK97 gp10 family phage protein